MVFVLRAIVMFVATNLDDLVLVPLFFATAGRDRAAAGRVVTGQLTGFALILVVSVLGAVGASLLPDDLVPYLGVVPIALGVRAGWAAWHRRRDDEQPVASPAPGVGAVFAVTVANGADNVGVYVPVFAVATPGEVAVYCGVFMVAMIGLCRIARALGTRPSVARVVARWGDVILPVVLCSIGLLVLVEGGAFAG